MTTLTTTDGLQSAIDAMPERKVSAEEIAHYNQHGWVRLEQFLPPAVVEAILAMGKDLMGEDGTGTPFPGKFSYFNTWPMNGLDRPVLGDVIRHFGECAVALANRRTNPGIRYFKDVIAVKLPSEEGGSHGRSDWHQDFAAQVSDRSGGMAFWTPLIDMTPRNGTMAYLSGSHRLGVMGDYRTYGDGNLLDSYPELLESCPASEYMTVQVGDVVVHSDMCVHEAGNNISGAPRWTYIAFLNPADARWTGAPAVSFETDGLRHLGTFDESRFPRIA